MDSQIARHLGYTSIFIIFYIAGNFPVLGSEEGGYLAHTDV